MELQVKTLKERILESGYRMDYIAKQLNIPKSTLSHYLNGTRTMPAYINNNIIKLITK